MGFFDLLSLFCVLYCLYSFISYVYNFLSKPVGQAPFLQPGETSSKKEELYKSGVIKDLKSLKSNKLDVLVVGCGPAGLAMGYRLKHTKKDCNYLIIEKGPWAGYSWYNRYSRLHLHTADKGSSLVGLPFPETYPKFIARLGEKYSKSDRILVIGGGNSGCEICLDLLEHNPSLKLDQFIRSPIHIVPRFLQLVTSYTFPHLFYNQPLKMYENSAKNIMHKRFKQLLNYNISFLDNGMNVGSNLWYKNKAPLIDIGWYNEVIKGKINVIKDCKLEFTNDGIINGKKYDCIILATGYVRDTYKSYLSGLELSVETLAEYSGNKEFKNENVKQMYFVGFRDYIGRIFQINVDTKNVMKDIENKFL